MPKNNSKKKGGSVASDRVNAFVPNFTSIPCKFKNTTSCVNNDITDKFAVKNYGSFFKTQGGKKKTQKKGGNNGANQYDTFKNYGVPYNGKINTSNLYGINYTNVPVKNSNVGGKKSKSKNKKNNSKKHKRQPGGASGPMAHRGDSNPVTGAAIPETWAQGVQNFWNGVTSVITDSPSNPTFPSGLQLACNSNDCNLAPDNVKYVNNENGVLGFKGNNVETIPKSQGLTFPESKMGIIGSDLLPISADSLPAPRAGGGRKSKKNKKKKKKKNKKKNLKHIKGELKVGQMEMDSVLIFKQL